jgi:hypothetical protein
MAVFIKRQRNFPADVMFEGLSTGRANIVGEHVEAVFSLELGLGRVSLKTFGVVTTAQRHLQRRR